MKYLSLLLPLLMVYRSNSQTLAIQKLTSADIKSGVEKKYFWQEEHAYGEIHLILFNNQRFRFSVNKFIGTEGCEGNWIEDGGVISLTSDIQKASVPIQVICNDDTTGRVNGFAISVIKNLKGADLLDELVCVNQDSIKCDPALGQCNASYKSVDSIKVIFSNGMSSKWVILNNKQGMQVHIVVQTNCAISSYIILSDQKYRISKNHLIPIYQ